MIYLYLPIKMVIVHGYVSLPAVNLGLPGRLMDQLEASRNSATWPSLVMNGYHSGSLTAFAEEHCSFIYGYILHG